MNKTKGGREVAIAILAALAVLVFPLSDSAAGIGRSSMDADRATVPSAPGCANVSGAGGLDLDVNNALPRWAHAGHGCEGAPGPC